MFNPTDFVIRYVLPDSPTIYLGPKIGDMTTPVHLLNALFKAWRAANPKPIDAWFETYGNNPQKFGGTVDEPKLKRALAVTFQSKIDSTIIFFACSDIAEQLKKYGSVETVQSFSDKYKLHVDARYDYEDVLAYVWSFAFDGKAVIRSAVELIEKEVEGFIHSDTFFGRHRIKWTGSSTRGKYTLTATVQVSYTEDELRVTTAEEIAEGFIEMCDGEYEDPDGDFDMPDDHD